METTVSGLPEAFTNRMKEQLGEDFDTFMASYDKPAEKALRLNRRMLGLENEKKGTVLKFSKSGNFENLRTVPFFSFSASDEVDWWPGAYYYTAASEPGKSPLHDAGAYYIQEPSAMLPVTMLNVDDSGLKVLDLCAAPGGKTTQIADLMNGCGLLVANEYVAGRASILSENVERMGVINSLVVNEDPKALSERFPAFFDRILVDAPCSGEGMFRKNPEAAAEWSPENVLMCADRQEMLLTCASSMLAPGGLIVYSTCTFSPEEDEGVIDRFLSNHSEYTTLGDPVRLFPHTFRGEGHFAAALARRTDVVWEKGTVPISQNHFRSMNETRGRFLPFHLYSQTQASSGSPDSGETEEPSPRFTDFGKLEPSPFPTLSRAEDALLCDFLKAAFRPESPLLRHLYNNKDRLLKFGDSLYLAPEYMPDIRGMKVKRAGLKLGTFMKNRFEPDHALSHAMTAEDAVHVIDLDPESDEARQYLSGLTLPCDPSVKGWCLVTTLGLPLGWGKASGSTVKNHYPRGLRH